jgi:hypothetical protein
MNMPWKNPPPALDMAKMAKSILTAGQAPMPLNGQPVPGAKLADVAPPPNHNFAALIDELGAVKAILSKAEKREKELLALIKPLGDGEHNGGKCICKITTGDRDTFDKKGLEAENPELVAKYTKPKPVTTVTIKALVS